MSTTAFTAGDLLDSLMRAAVQPAQVLVGFDDDGKPIHSTATSLVQPILDRVVSLVLNDKETSERLRSMLLDLIVKRIGEAAAMTLARLPGTVLWTRSGSYGRTGEVEIATWAKPAIQDALARAFTEVAGDLVATHLQPTDLTNYQVTVNVTLAPKENR